MKKLVLCCVIAVVCVLVVCGLGGYSSVMAQNRKVPVYKTDTAENKVAISFDAAWGADKTRQIMDICDAYNVKATFFLVGFWVEKYPEIVAEIDKRGFEIGTHSATHPKMSTLSTEKINSELTESSAKISAITGKQVRLFRPPFGDYNNTLLGCAENLNLLTIQWSLDSLDWKGLSADQIASRLQKMQKGDIILCHNNSDHITEALPLVLESARLKGLQIVPVGELVYFNDFVVDGNGVQHSTATKTN